jgi:hypothetical protein
MGIALYTLACIVAVYFGLASIQEVVVFTAFCIAFAAAMIIIVLILDCIIPDSWEVF